MFAPIVPPAPVRFSITTGCPQFSLIFCEMMRASVSVPPPGENDTTGGSSWSEISAAPAQPALPGVRRQQASREHVAAVSCQSFSCGGDHVELDLEAGLDLRCPHGAGGRP